MKKLRSSTRQQGISLVESIATLGIMSAVAVGTLFMSTQYTEDTRTAGAAEHMRVIAEATRLYVRDHRAALIAQATPTKPVLLTTSALATAGYLPAGYSLRNAFDQNVCALVLEPSTGVLNGLVVAEGGQALDDVTLAHFSSLMGAGGGGLFTVNSASLQGAGGAWTMPLAAFNGLPNSLGFRCNGTTPGAVQISIGTPVYAQWLNGTDTADPGFLSRDVVPGNPGANTMQTTLNLGGNRISNLNTVTIGAGCGAGVTDGELSSGPGGEVVSCVSGVWTAPGKAYWGATVGTFSALPGCAASNLGETRRVTDITGVFVCDGLRWDAALNTSNNLSLPQHLRVAGNATVAGNARINGTTNLYGATTAHAALNANAGVNVGSGQSVHGTGSMQVETTGNLYLKPWAPAGQVIVGGSGGSGNLSASGSVQASNRLIAGTRVVAGEYLQINGIASEGAGCAPNGLTGRTSSGALLSCQSGVWKKLGGTPSSCVLHPIPTYYTESARTYQCPSGYVMKGSRYYYWKNGVQTQTHLVCCN